MIDLAVRKRYNSQWAKEHSEQRRKSKQESNERLKTEVLLYYGNGKLCCVRCGFSDVRVLCLDHINGGGLRHRRELQTKSGLGFYRKLRQLGYPKGMQVLCSNCNVIKGKVEDLRK